MVRSEAPNRSDHGRPGRRLSGGGHATTAQGRRASSLEGAAFLVVGPGNADGGSHRSCSGPGAQVRRGLAERRPVGAHPPDPMSKFFQALERAEQDQALRHPAAPSAPPPSAPATVPGRAFPPPVPYRAPRPSVAPPDDVSNELDEHLVRLLAPSSFEAEQYRALRHLIEQRHKSSELSVVAVSSARVADGKTTTAINLAGALAQAPDARVLVVDADLRGATLATHLGFDERAVPGLVDAILDTGLTFEAVVHLQPHLNLSVLPAGRVPSSPYEVLKSPRLGELLA